MLSIPAAIASVGCQSDVLTSELDGYVTHTAIGRWY